MQKGGGAIGGGGKKAKRGRKSCFEESWVRRAGEKCAVGGGERLCRRRLRKDQDRGKEGPLKKGSELTEGPRKRPGLRKGGEGDSREDQTRPKKLDGKRGILLRAHVRPVSCVRARQGITCIGPSCSPKKFLPKKRPVRAEDEGPATNKKKIKSSQTTDLKKKSSEEKKDGVKGVPRPAQKMPRKKGADKGGGGSHRARCGKLVKKNETRRKVTIRSEKSASRD